MNNAAIIKVSFEGAELELVPQNGGPGVAVFRRLCEAIGVDDSSQRKKAKRAADLGEEWAIAINRGVNTSVAEDGKQREMVVLPIPLIPAWAQTISPARVPAEIRPRLIAFRNKAAEVLARALFSVASSYEEKLKRFLEVQARWLPSHPPTTPEARLISLAHVACSSDDYLGNDHAFAERMGVPVATVEAWLSGTKKPKAEQQAKMLRIIGKTSLAELPPANPIPSDPFMLELMTLSMEIDIEPSKDRRQILHEHSDAVYERMVAAQDPKRLEQGVAGLLSAST